ncbi:MAG: PLP-dependent transferase [Comamonadaceae bacterium]|nr:PLP-dependent transferase [Comamonadaceae bacterium]
MTPNTQAVLRRDAVQSADRDRRHRRARRRSPMRARCAAGGRQLLLHAGAAAAAGTRRRPRDPLGHQVPRRPGPRARRRRAAAASALIEEVFKFLRTAGPTLSPFNAWVHARRAWRRCSIRMRGAVGQCARARRAGWRRSRRWRACFYPGLPSHPQHALAMRQQTSGGAIVSFEVTGGARAAPGAWSIRRRLLSITANLGDTKTTITPSGQHHSRPHQRRRRARQRA